MLSKGTYTVAQPLSVTSLAPTSGSGSSQQFTAVYTDVNGAGNFNSLLFWIGSAGSGATIASAASSCQIRYTPAANQISLLQDDGATWSSPLTPGSGLLSNSQCILLGSASGATISGNTATLNLSLTFLAPYAGAKNIVAYASDTSENTGWNNVGTWTASAPVVPALSSFTPGTGSGPYGTSYPFTFAFTDAAGYADIETIDIVFGGTSNTASCAITYYRDINTLNLWNDAGTTTTGNVPGTAGSSPLSNSRCAINVVNTVVSASGNSLSITLPVTFASTYTGQQPIYVMVEDSALLGSGWAEAGIWTVTGPGPTLSSVSVAPASVTSGRSATITAALSGVAPSGGAAVTLSSTSVSALPVPATLTIAAGSSTGSASITAGSVGNQTAVTVSGTYNYISQSASVTVVPATVAPPSFSPPAGSYPAAQTIALCSGTNGASIRYTTDGSMPNETNGVLYDAPFILSASATVNAIAYKSGYLDSPIASATYTIGGASDWYNSAWAHRKPITISHSQVGGASDLTNFPVLISWSNDPNLQSEAKTDGSDILFTDSSGTLKLNHEIEQYVSSSGQVQAWVLVPTVSASSDTTIYMYYGNPSAASQQNATGVWNGVYKGVWHFGSGAPLADSSGTGNTLTSNGTTAVTGQIAGAISNPGAVTDGLMVPSPTGLYDLTTYTQSAWVNPLSFTGPPTLYGPVYLYSVGFNKSFAIEPDGTIESIIANSGIYTYSTSVDTVSTASWAYLVTTFSPSDHLLHVYLNGIEVSYAVQSAGDGSALPDSSAVGIGLDGGNNYAFNLTGTIDEVRIANTSRSAGWIATEYHNQSSPGTFYGVGAEQNAGGTGTVVHRP